MSLSAACIGECMVELRPASGGLYARDFAGDAYNTAVYMRRELGAGGEVAFVTALGDDALSGDMRRAFRGEGLDDRFAYRVPGGTPGLYMIELDAQGDRSFLYWRSASAARGWLRALEAAGGAEALAGFDLVYLSGISLAILPPEDRTRALTLLAALKGRGPKLAFDPNVRLRLWRDAGEAAGAIEVAAGLVDVLLPSSQDGELLWGETDVGAQILRWRGLGAGEIAITLAASGARVVWPGGEADIRPVPAARVIDTSGAGDSFNGAYLAARLRGLEPPQAAARGLALASRVVSFPGAIAPA